MKLSTKGRYAVMALADLAIYDRMGPVSLRDVSLRQNISLMYLEQIFLKLKKNNIVKSMRGNKGGYKLSKDANEIVISEVIQAVDEDLEATACNGKSNCHNNHQCISHNLWQDLGTEINNFLSDITLKQVIAKNNSDVKEIKLSEY